MIETFPSKEIAKHSPGMFFEESFSNLHYTYLDGRHHLAQLISVLTGCDVYSKEPPQKQNVANLIVGRCITVICVFSLIYSVAGHFLVPLPVCIHCSELPMHALCSFFYHTVLKFIFKYALIEY